MLEGFLLPNVGIRVFVLLGGCVWWKQAEDEMSGLASLFTALARGESDHQPEVEPTAKVTTLHFDVTCPWCLSDDTKPLNKSMDIYQCSVCGEVFARPLSG